MFDPTTGAVRFSDGTTISSSLTRSEFLEASFGKTREVSVKNEPWCSWRVTRMPAGDRFFVLVLQFYAERLLSLKLVESDLVGFADWKDWSETDELRKKRTYEKLLSRELGRRRSFHWGSVGAAYDPRSGSSFIFLTYGKDVFEDVRSSRHLAAAFAGIAFVASAIAFALGNRSFAAFIAALGVLILVFGPRTIAQLNKKPI